MPTFDEFQRFCLSEVFKEIDEEIRKKGITISLQEAIKDDLYD